MRRKKKTITAREKKFMDYTLGELKGMHVGRVTSLFLGEMKDSFKKQSAPKRRGRPKKTEREKRERKEEYLTISERSDKFAGEMVTQLKKRVGGKTVFMRHFTLRKKFSFPHRSKAVPAESSQKPPLTSS